jgi:hypothetical protein
VVAQALTHRGESAAAVPELPRQRVHLLPQTLRLRVLDEQLLLRRLPRASGG